MRRPGTILLVPAALGVAALLSAASFDRRVAGAAPADQTRERGAAVYAERCAKCHDTGIDRAPTRNVLGLLTIDSIERSLNQGVMVPMAAGLSAGDKRAVAEFLPVRAAAATVTKPLAVCARESSPFDYAEPPVFSGWGLTPNNTHAITAATAGISRANIGQLELKWALAFPGALRARSQPALAGGAIFVGSHDGTVYALDRETGCARWTFRARAEVRTGIVVSPWASGDKTARPALYFGDLVGYAYAVDALTGQEIWSDEVDPTPSATITGTPTLHAGRLYVPVSTLEESGATARPECCVSRGSVAAYDAATGKRIWQTFTTDPPTDRGVNAAGQRRLGPSGASVFGSPMVDVKRRRLVFGTGNNHSEPATPTSDAIVAVDLETGKVIWVTQVTSGDIWPGDGPDFGFGAAPVLATASDGREYLLAGEKSGIAYGLDPESGKMLWQTKVGRGGIGGGVQFGIAVQDDKLFVPIHDRVDGRTYTHPRSPGIYALDIRNGHRLWDAPLADVCNGRPACYPGYAGAITATPELVLAGSTDGHVRAYDTNTGAVLWSFDTVREFTAVNGDIAKGGSMAGGAAPLAYRGLLIVNSGYYAFNDIQAPGNALLVLSAR